MDRRTYNSWKAMIYRCYRKSNESYPLYGGRGIKVCKRWRGFKRDGGSGFKNFLADMGARPLGKTIERKNNNRGYSPKNCKWATPKEQSNNTRQTKYLTVNGLEKSMREWGDSFGVQSSVLYFQSRYHGITLREVIRQRLISGKGKFSHVWARS